MRRIFLLLFTFLLFCAPSAAAEERHKWPGVDEIVVEQFARDLGREPWDPFFDTDQGDLLLFFFALAGAVGGFIMGYCWHKVFVAKKDLEKKNGL
jgi:cobalt/nickel transport protein